MIATPGVSPTKMTIATTSAAAEAIVIVAADGSASVDCLLTAIFAS